MVGCGVGSVGGASGGVDSSGVEGRHGRWVGIFGVVVGDREFGWSTSSGGWVELRFESYRRLWRETVGCSRYYEGEPLSDPRPGDVCAVYQGSRAGTLWCVLVDGQWVAAPPIPGPFRGGTQLQEEGT